MADDEQAAQPVTISTPSVSIQPLPEFNPDSEVGASLATRWTNWLDDFEMFILASGITDEKRKRALLLYQAGQRVREIFHQLPNTGTAADYKTATDKLTEYFEPQKNRRYEVYRFRQATQEAHETLDQFHTRLRTLAQTCSFADADFEIEQQIVTAGSSSRIRKKALRDPTYDLKAILIDGRRDEQSAYQARDIESKEQKNEALRKLQETATKCRNCGGLYTHTNHCPAKGKQCKKCGKQNHFAKVCRSKPEQKENPPASQGNRYKHKLKKPVKPLRNIEHEKYDTESSDSDENYLYAVTNTTTPKVNVKICQHSFKATVDTGASINVIDQNTYAKLKGVELQRTSVK